MTRTETRTLDTTRLLGCARRCAKLATRDYGPAGESTVVMPEKGVALLGQCEGWCRELVAWIGQYPSVLTEQRLLDSDELAPWYRFEMLVADLPGKVRAAAGLNRLRPTSEDPAAWTEAEQLLNRLGELIDHTRSYLATR